MKALVLAAGRGKRMRELTAKNCKPLLAVWGRPMIEWQLLQLEKAGFKDVVINAAHCSHLLKEKFASGRFSSLNIELSIEGTRYEDALETRGGIAKALPLLTDGREPFLVVSGDIVTDFDYHSLLKKAGEIRAGRFLAHLVLVPNPDYHRRGDMGLVDGRVAREPKEFTYGNIGVFSPSLFEGIKPEFAPLFPWLYGFVERGSVSGELYEGSWANVGTPEELAKVENQGSFLGQNG